MGFANNADVADGLHALSDLLSDFVVLFKTASMPTLTQVLRLAAAVRGGRVP